MLSLHQNFTNQRSLKALHIQLSTTQMSMNEKSMYSDKCKIKASRIADSPCSCESWLFLSWVAAWDFSSLALS